MSGSWQEIPKADAGDRRREEGGAFVVVLMILLLLTLLGLSLVLATQSEIRSGGIERALERTFYTAETGVHLSVGRALGDGDFGGVRFVRQRAELDGTGRLPVVERSVSSPFFCLGDAPCNFCAINQGRGFVRRNHVLSVIGTRETPDGSVELSRKALNLMVDIEPSERLLDCLAELPEESGFSFR